MLEICAIASGSNGNCYYVGNNTDAILIDAGLSGKQIINRMTETGLDPAKIKAVFITHEHGDHMRGARGISKKLQVPIYITAKTYNSAYKNMRPDYPKYFSPNEEIQVGEFTVYPVQKKHDAAEPCSFRIQYNNKNIGVFTDIGEPCENVKTHISKCDGLFLESNYDDKMLWEGVYPYFLKQRVASEVGHLSNDQAFELLEEHTNGNLQCVFLSHISKENNTPEKAMERMESLTSRFEVKVAPRYEASDIYKIQ
ncbi:MBL fold metallo-hydrolase [Prolixibacteraceae bacterium Z1-6]|uniref:MBL fold metallo-hydrolase n=1 Tax=Draconibacterium aestuarii TaxID=2998507 RepID=A0A9X3FBZ9_9BACT|nr:MBL fold metallo-hydrolase [Prolixibacteraceae bacterium Z1-6]